MCGAGDLHIHQWDAAGGIPAMDLPRGPSPGAASSPALWQRSRGSPRAWEGFQLSTAHPALRNYQGALMELDRVSWCLI